MAKAKKHKWTAEEVIDLLRERYDKTGNGNSKRYVFVEQVAPATGFAHKSTWIDAMVFSMWPSDGIHREAFEVKVSRSDFLSEINNPHKNAWFMDNSHMFWYVTAPGVVNAADEVPEGCGWMLAQKGRLVVKKQATKRGVDNTISGDFFAAVARAMDKERAMAVYRAQVEARKQPAVVHALETARTLQGWLTSIGVVTGQRRYQAFAWETSDELKELLARALAGEGDAELADAIEGRLQMFRDDVTSLILTLLPYAADLLSKADGIGGVLAQTMGSGTFDMLADLRKRSDRRTPAYLKKAHKQKLELITELLTVAKAAEADHED